MPKSKRQKNIALCEAMIEQMETSERELGGLKKRNRKLVEECDLLKKALRKKNDTRLAILLKIDELEQQNEKIKEENKRLKKKVNQKSDSKQRSGKHVPGKVDYF